MRMMKRIVTLSMLAMACARGTSDRPDEYRPVPGRVEEGLASWYGPGFHGRTTASGIPFDSRAMVAAHPTHPFGTRVRVLRIASGRSVDVEIVDRGPAAGPRREGVVIDLSEGAAEALGFIRAGRTRVRIQVLSR
jgi:rare lipoprotein A